MKFKVQMKDPDTLGDAIQDAAKESIDAMPGLSGEEKEVLIEKREEMLGALAATWFKYGEYLCIEIDTDACTCTVLPASD